MSPKKKKWRETKRIRNGLKPNPNPDREINKGALKIYLRAKLIKEKDMAKPNLLNMGR